MSKRPTQQVRFTPRPSSRIDEVEDGHQPFIPADESPVELTIGGIVLGVFLGLLFAASSVYLALKVSLTVSASIPIAVLSITIFKWVQKAAGAEGPQILRNNIVQTTGSAGESIAAGIAFTLPALLLLGYELPYWNVAAVGMVGGLLGVLLMIPLRQSLIVKEHKQLKYPEGTACAEVLIVGETAGAQAKTVFSGFGLGVLYKFLNAGVHLWTEVPSKIFQRIAPSGKPELFGQISAEVSPELAGVGYIIGPKIAGYLFAGGMLSYFVLIPVIKLFGAGLAEPLFAAKKIADMTPGEVRGAYVFYIGAGAVTTAGLVSLVRALPTIVSALSRGFSGFGGGAGDDATPRTARDLPMTLVLGGVAACVLAMIVLPQIHINVVGALLALFFAFLFVTVSSRVAGQIGASANPISGMTVATVLLTALLFYAAGWTKPEHRALALSIGGVVCVAAAVAAATSQDLKTGYLVGATPRRQQIGLFAGVSTSALVIGGIITFLNEAKTTLVVRDYPGVTIAASAIDAATRTAPDGKAYRVGHLYEPTGDAPAGRYLVDDAGTIKYLVDPGIGGRERVGADGKEVDKLDSPKSQIMSLVVDGILTQKLPWGLILIGAFLTVAMEILGLSSLPIAVGVYLPISTSATMFMGGVVRWLVDRKVGGGSEEEGPSADSGPGVLFSSGLIAGGAITGVLLTAVAVKGWDSAFNLSKVVGAMGESAGVGIVAFLLLVAAPLYVVGTKKG